MSRKRVQHFCICQQWRYDVSMSDKKNKLEEALEKFRELFSEEYQEFETVRHLNGFKLIRTCIACPEQYDVYKVNEDGSEENVAYLRLRHGTFRAECPFNGPVVYKSTDMRGDGTFYDEERDQFLNEALEKVKEFYEK